MQLARIIVLVLVAIAITAAIAVGVGTVGKAGADEPGISGNGEVKLTGRVGTFGHKCAYHVSVGNVLEGKDIDADDILYWQIWRSDPRPYRSSFVETFHDSGHFIGHDIIEIGPFRASDIQRDYEYNPMPARDDNNNNRRIWFWRIQGSNDKHYQGGFNGPWRNDLHEELLECANATPTPTPSPTATSTPDVIATPTPSPTATATTAPSVQISVTVTPTPRSAPSVQATPTASPTPVVPTATATPVPIPDPQDDNAALVAAIRAFIAALQAWLDSQN